MICFSLNQLRFISSVSFARAGLYLLMEEI